MAILHIERIGGLAGFGGVRARIRSRGQIDTAELSPSEQQAMDLLLQGKFTAEKSRAADTFQFQITYETASGTKTVVVPEAAVPAKVAACVKDEFV